MVRVIQCDTIKNLMSAEDDTVTIALSKPEALVNIDSRVVGVRLRGVGDRGSSWSTHTILYVSISEFVRTLAHSFRRISGSTPKK
jgi:hypothetical protein